METEALPLLSDEAVLTVSEMTQQIAAALDQLYPMPVWVRGEITNYRGRNQRGHIYLSLKDSEAVLPAVFFSRQNQKLDLELSDGLEVLAFGRLNVYAPHGRYQLVIERLLPGGLGELFIRFEKLKKKLAAEGLFAEERKRSIPRFPSTIGMVTSPTGAVVRDMLKILSKRYPQLRVVLVPTQVQGEGAAASIVAAIEALNNLSDPKIDTIILARGGGSLEDLWCFNEESVARAIFSSRAPIISAIGHETDFTISDFVADARAATPTHAAELVVPSRDELLRELQRIAERLFMTLRHEVQEKKSTLQRCANSTALRFPEKRLVDLKQNLDRLLERSDFAWQRGQQQRQLKWGQAKGQLDGLNPLKVLERGFAVAEKIGGAVVRDASQVTSGEKLRLRLWRGNLQTTVIKTEGYPEEINDAN